MRFVLLMAQSKPLLIIQLDSLSSQTVQVGGVGSDVVGDAVDGLFVGWSVGSLVGSGVGFGVTGVDGVGFGVGFGVPGVGGSGGPEERQNSGE